MALDQVQADEIESLAHRAIELSLLWEKRATPRLLDGVRIGLITDLPGWRNPTALALGAAEMGAVCVPINVSLDGKETIEDLAGYLDNWFDCLAIRTPSLDVLRKMAGMLDAPVVNLRTNDNHPIEALGDLSFALTQRSSWQGMQVAVVAPAGNILQSWIEAAAVLPISVVQISHPSFFAKPPNDRFTQCDTLAALRDADLIVTDCWPESAGTTPLAHLAKLRITADVLQGCRKDAMFIPCPPVTRGREVSLNAMVHPKCKARAAKAFLLHVQNAVLEHVILG